MGFEILLTVLFVLLLANFISLDITVSQMKKDRLKLDVLTAITALEMATKKLNEKLKYETQSLSDYKQRLKRLEKRIDILEEGHPDSDFDYATTDDDGNITEVWVDGKKYILEDKPDEDVIKLYADNKVMAETTRSDVKCCATCRHYRPGSGCARKPWLNRSQRVAMYATSACNNYEEVSTPCVSSDKGKVEYSYITYKDMCGNARTEQLTKMIDDLNYFYNVGLMSAATYMHRWEELMQDDT